MVQVIYNGKADVSLDEPKKEITWQEKTINMDSILDIQWWLYKGALTRQPLEKSYYKGWFDIYKSYRDVIDSINDSEFNRSNAVKDLSNIKKSIQENTQKLESVLSDDVLVELSIASSKLEKGITNIIKQIQPEGEEFWFGTN